MMLPEEPRRRRLSGKWKLGLAIAALVVPMLSWFGFALYWHPDGEIIATSVEIRHDTIDERKYLSLSAQGTLFNQGANTGIVGYNAQSFVADVELRGDYDRNSVSTGRYFCGTGLGIRSLEPGERSEILTVPVSLSRIGDDVEFRISATLHHKSRIGTAFQKWIHKSPIIHDEIRWELSSLAGKLNRKRAVTLLSKWYSVSEFKTPDLAEYAHYRFPTP